LVTVSDESAEASELAVPLMMAEAAEAAVATVENAAAIANTPKMIGQGEPPDDAADPHEADPHEAPVLAPQQVDGDRSTDEDAPMLSTTLLGEAGEDGFGSGHNPQV